MKTRLDIEGLEERARIVDAARKLIWLPPFAAAAYGGFKLSKMWELISDRVIPSAHDGGITVVRREALDKYWFDRMRVTGLSQKAQTAVSEPRRQSVCAGDDSHKAA